MAIEKWRPRLMTRNPFREMARFEQDMESLFGRLPQWPWIGRETDWAPAVDMVDEADALVVRADLPGFDEKDLDVTVKDSTLTLRGERKEEKEEKKQGYYYSERSYGSFVRTLSLPVAVEAGTVKATFTKGVLEVRLPKAKAAEGTKIEVKAA